MLSHHEAVALIQTKHAFFAAKKRGKKLLSRSARFGWLQLNGPATPAAHDEMLPSGGRETFRAAGGEIHPRFYGRSWRFRPPSCHQTAKAAAKAPNIHIKTIRPINDITSPAMANPRGALKTPMNENIKPRIHRIQHKTGTQQKTSATMARTNPATPIPFVFLTGVWGMLTNT